MSQLQDNLSLHEFHPVIYMEMKPSIARTGQMTQQYPFVISLILYFNSLCGFWRPRSLPGSDCIHTDVHQYASFICKNNIIPL